MRDMRLGNMRLKCSNVVGYDFCFPKLIFLSGVLPLNIRFRIIRLIFKKCYIHGVI